MLTKEQSKNVMELIEALESGEYEQTGGQLRRGNEFCCLGVACHISGIGYWRGKRNETYQVGPDTEYGEFSGLTLPRSVRNHYGFSSGDGCIVSIDNRLDSISSHNDKFKSFDQIAKALREWLKEQEIK